MPTASSSASTMWSIKPLRIGAAVRVTWRDLPSGPIIASDTVRPARMRCAPPSPPNTAIALAQVGVSMGTQRIANRSIRSPCRTPARHAGDSPGTNGPCTS